MKKSQLTSALIAEAKECATFLFANKFISRSTMSDLSTEIEYREDNSRRGTEDFIEKVTQRK